MAFLPDNPDLYKNLTARQFLDFVADIYRVSMEKRQAAIEKYSKMFELDTSLDQLISAYSHGMKQRLALIAALLHEPELLILDEPFVGLDPKGAYYFKQIMRDLASQGHAIFFSTHVLEVAGKKYLWSYRKMTNILLLLKVQLYSTFSLNDLRKGGFGRYFKLGLLFILLLLFSGYNLLTALSLVKLGQANLIPAYMIALVSFIIFFFSLMQSNGILFDQEELDRLIVLPLSIREIVYEKSAFLYLLNSVFAVLLMLPAGLVWFGYGASLLELLLYLLLMGFVPLFPLCLASLLGLCVAYIASKAPHKNLAAFLFSLFLLLGLATGSMWAMRAGLSAENVGLLLTKQLTSLYPPASLFFNPQHFWWTSLLLMLISFVLTGLFLRYLSRNYLKMNQMITGVKSESKVYRSRQKSPFMALYRREIANFMTSYLYMLNSGLGTILIIVLAISLCFMTPDVLFFRLDSEIAENFYPYYWLAVSVFPILQLSVFPWRGKRFGCFRHSRFL